MPPVELYLYLFSDALLAALILPLQSNLVFPVLKAFAEQPLMLLVAVASLGGVLGAFGNLYLGYVIRLASQKRGTMLQGKIIDFLRSKGHYLLIIAPIPGIGALYTLLCGFAGVSIKKSVLLIVPAYMVFYLFF